MSNYEPGGDMGCISLALLFVAMMWLLSEIV